MGPSYQKGTWLDRSCAGAEQWPLDCSEVFPKSSMPPCLKICRESDRRVSHHPFHRMSRRILKALWGSDPEIWLLWKIYIEGSRHRSQTLDRYYRPINVSKQFPVCTNKSAKNPVSLSFWISLSELGVLQSKNRMISAFGPMTFVMMFNWLVRRVVSAI